MYATFECPKCGHENTAEVDLGEHLSDFSDECENLLCGYKFTETEKLDIYEETTTDAWGSAIDRALITRKIDDL